ncbi:VCBS repeat-containing protein [bacterium]|nr:VCBS repeat-containing protein [bacterium]
MKLLFLAIISFCLFSNKYFSPKLKFKRVNEVTFYKDGSVLGWAIGDLDGDSIPEIVYTGPVWGKGLTHTKVKLSYLSVKNNKIILDENKFGNEGLVHGREGKIVDIDHDGLKDVIMVGHGYDADPFPGEINLAFLNKGTHFKKVDNFFPLKNNFTHGISTGDVNKDGLEDFFINNMFPGPSYFLLSNKDKYFTKNLDEVTLASKIFDLDKDGKQDLILSNNDGKDSAVIYWGSPKFFSEKTKLPIDNKYPVIPDIAIGDINNDGKEDILLSSTSERPNFYQTRNIQILLNLGNRNFENGTDKWIDNLKGKAKWSERLHLVDLNKDGKLDLVSSQHRDMRAIMWLNTGNKFEVYLHAPKGYLIPADFNKDGKLDILAYYQKGRSSWTLYIQE